MELDEFLEGAFDVAYYTRRLGWDPAERFLERDLEPWQWEVWLEVVTEWMGFFEWQSAEAVKNGGAR